MAPRLIPAIFQQYTIIIPLYNQSFTIKQIQKKKNIFLLIIQFLRGLFFH